MKRILLAAFFLSTGATHLFAQGYRGHDFWIAFPQNAVLEDNRKLELSLFITAETRTTGTIQNMMDSSIKPFSVEGGASVQVDIDTEIELRSSSLIEPKSLHITSDHDITLYVVSHRPASTDSYCAIPTDLLGTRYIATGYTALRNGPESFTSEATVVATQDNTLLTVHLTAPTLGGLSESLPKGRTAIFPLNRGEAVQLASSTREGGSDFTGTTFSATKPVAFFTGHRCAQVPPAITFCDMLLEEEPPESDWGRAFILTKFQSKDYYVARVVAGSKATNVFLDGKPVDTLEPGGYYEVDTLHSDAVITTSEPALVAQYATSASADEVKVGDPFMLIAVPNDRFIKEVTTTSVVNGFFDHYLNVVIPKDALSSLSIDDIIAGTGKDALWTNPLRESLAPGGNYLVLTFHVPEGRHLLRCAKPMAVYAYGFGSRGDNYDSYGHACGMRLGK